MALDWPLTGRYAALRAVDGAVRGSGGVVLAGAAGVGKTRLAREALPGARWVVGTASARGVPLGAFAGVVDTAGGTSAQVVRRAVDALAGTATVVDDAHLLDDLSATVVHQLVVRRACTVVVTLRTGRPAPDAVTALWKDEHLTRVELGALCAADTLALLEAALGGPLDSAASAQLWTLTGGNPLFLRHIVDAELAGGRLCQVEGVWGWSGRPTISGELAEIISGQMGELPEPIRDVVDLLALGEPLPAAALGDPIAVEDAEARRLVRVDERLDVRLAHPLYGEVRAAGLGRLRARRLRGRLALGTPDPLRRAVLALDSDLDPDPDLFLAAAREALRLSRLELTERLARAAGDRFDAQLVLAYALTWLSRGEEADRVLAGLGDGARVAVPRAGNLFWTLGRADEALAVLNAVPDREHPVVAAMRVAFTASLGRPRAALADGTRLLERDLDPALADQAIVLLACGTSAAGAALGRVGDVRRVAPLGYRAARSPDAVIVRFGVADFHLLALRLAGDVAELGPIAAQRRAESAEAAGPAPLMGLVLLGQAELAAGRVRTAGRLLREAWAGFTAFPTHEFRWRCRPYLAQALAAAGEPEAARRMLPTDPHPAYTLLEPDTGIARARVCAAEGAVTEAVAAARAAAELARRQDSPAYEVMALQTAVTFGDRSAADRLAELVTEVEGPRAPAAAAHARALADDDADALLAAAGRWERLADLLAAADAAAQAATAFHRQGLRGSAAAAAHRAHRLALACEGATSPALAAAARPLPLTGREREIVTLAARGLTNREIAERLVVSVRTVEGHLYRAGHKLGVGDRAGLAAVVFE
jgi:DNA-binding NarL/FixJ family response regulator